MTAYATNDEVRREAGFTNNANISDPLDIELAANAANARVEAAIAQRYTLPLSDNGNWTDSPAEALLKTLAAQIGASILLKKMYEGQGGELIHGQNERSKGAKQQLTLIAGGQLLLVGSDGDTLARITTTLTVPSGYPNKSDLANSEDEKLLPTVDMNEIF